MTTMTQPNPMPDPMPSDLDPTHLDDVARLTKDLATAAATLSDAEARYLVDAYYAVQGYRIAAGNQVSALSKSGEPHAVLAWLLRQQETVESQIRRALDRWTDQSIVGRWSKSIIGIGPVLAAGLLAHIDIERAPTVGHIWRFAGLDPTVIWLGRDGAERVVNEVFEKYGVGKGDPVPAEVIAALAIRTNRKPEAIRRLGEDRKTGKITRASLITGLARRPWNTPLKTLCWKIGESFVKVQAHPQDFYGRLYAQRKAIEEERNANGAFAEQAKAALAAKRYGVDTEARARYERGELPQARLHLRATRYATKLFLAHWHHVAYEVRYGIPPPLPYVIAHQDHGTLIKPPHWPME